MSKPTLLVTGASGKLGRRVVQLLLEADAGTVIAATRKPEKIADLGATVRHADFDDARGLVTAFAGVDALLLVSTDALDRPGRRVAQHRAAVAAAVEAGVQRIVYTSLTRPDAGSPILVAPDHRETEAAIVATPLAYTLLRNNWYTDMMLGALPHVVASGQLVAAAGDGAVGYVTREDCARIAAAVLAAGGAGREILDVTGPAAVTHAELAATLTKLTGRSVRYVPVDAATRKAGLVAAGLPPHIADVLVSFEVGAAEGRLGVVSDAVERLTGKPPEGVADFLARHRNLLG